MLKSALNYRCVFENLHCYDGNYIDNPSKEEWSRTEKMSKFLLPFYQVTTLMSGTSYPTSNLYFLQVWKIQCLLIHSKNDEDEVIRSMAERMMIKFDKYWEEYSVVFAYGTILDPRMKLDTLGICYEKIDPHTDLKVEKIKRKLYELFSEYSTKASSSKVPKSIQPSSSKSSEPSLFDELKARRQGDATKTGKSRLDIYLGEAVLDLDFTEQMDVLQWWKNHSQRFPELSIMA